MKKFSVQLIANQKLLSRYNLIKPIIKIDGKKFFAQDLSPEQLRRLSYMCLLPNEQLDENIYTPVYQFECFHKYGFSGFFHPTVASVLSQIPENEIPYIDAFELIRQDEKSNMDAFKQGYHTSTVILYKKIDNLHTSN